PGLRRWRLLVVAFLCLHDPCEKSPFLTSVIRPSIQDWRAAPMRPWSRMRPTSYPHRADVVWTLRRGGPTLGAHEAPDASVRSRPAEEPADRGSTGEHGSLDPNAKDALAGTCR